MARLLIILSFLLSPVRAFAVDLSLSDVTLYELAALTFTQVKKTDYITDSSFQDDKLRVTVSYRDKTPEQIYSAVISLVKSHGFFVLEMDDALYISRNQPDSSAHKRPFYYKPKYRPTSYLTQVLTPIFPATNFHPKQDALPNENQTINQQEENSPTSALGQFNRDFDAFVFYGTDNQIELMKHLLVDLDKPQHQILVRAHIYEVTKMEGDSSSFGAALTLLNGKLTLDLAAQAFANQIAFTAPDIQAVFSAIASDGRFKTVSSPTLMVKDRTKAVFTVGQEVPVLAGITTTGTGVTNQSIQYVSSGVILELEPTIRGEHIQLQINHQLSNFINTTTGVNNSPTLQKREISTTIDALHDQIIMLGGLEQTSENESKSGFPLLPDFLKTRSRDNSQTDILLVLHVQKL